MLLKRITVAAGAVSDWIPVNRRSWGNIGFTVNPQPSAAGTYDVEFTESQLQRGIKKVPISRSTTVLTVNLVNHGGAVGDDAVITESGNYDGVLVIASVVSADSFTVTVSASGDSTSATIAIVIADDLVGFTAASGKESGIVDASIVAMRLNCTNSTTAAHDILINQFEN